MANITDVARKLGVSEKTVRRRIKAGKLTAVLRGNPATYDIKDPDDRGGDIRTAGATGMDGGQSHKDESPRGETASVDWVREYIDSLKSQLDEKDGQIRELHVLLQRSQERQNDVLAGGRPGRRFWWPFG